MKVAPAFIVAALVSTTASAEPLDMIGFFTGKTHADNVISIALHHPHKLIVDSIGGRNKEGEFVLIDTINEEGKPVRKRVWLMHPVGPNHFTGTLSDASGPVDVVVNGDTATIRYTMKDGGLKIDQQLHLENGDLANHAVARKFGLKFATVDGVIRRSR